MPHREPVNFAEFSKPFMAASDAGGHDGYPSEKQQEVARELRAVERARQAINHIQQHCDHERRVVNLAPARRLFQCQDCGLTRHRPFGSMHR